MISNFYKYLSRSEAVFKVDLENNESVYLSISKTEAINDERFVVIVESERFLNLWQNDPVGQHSNLANGNKHIWKNDYKYDDADKSFKQGSKNPVPLTEIACEYDSIDKVNYCAFIDGITRTIWLLANGAIEFPVECYGVDSAKRLSKLAGKPGDCMISVEALFVN